MNRLASIITALAWGLWFGGAIALFLFVSHLFEVNRPVATKAAPEMFVLFGRCQLVFAVVALVGAALWRPGGERLRHKFFLGLLFFMLLMLAPLGWMIGRIVEQQNMVNPVLERMHLALSGIAIVGLMIWRMLQSDRSLAKGFFVMLVLAAAVAIVLAVAVNPRMHLLVLNHQTALPEFRKFLHPLSMALGSVAAVLLLVAGVLMMLSLPVPATPPEPQRVRRIVRGFEPVIAPVEEEAAATDDTPPAEEQGEGATGGEPTEEEPTVPPEEPPTSPEETPAKDEPTPPHP